MSVIVYLAAAIATAILASLTARSMGYLRAALKSPNIPASIASCVVLNICLLVAWLAALQCCVGVAKGASPNEQLGVLVFFYALAIFLFKKQRGISREKLDMI